MLKMEQSVKTVLDPGDIGDDSAVILSHRKMGMDYVPNLCFSWVGGCNDLRTKLESDGYTVNDLCNFLVVMKDSVYAYVYKSLNLKAVGYPEDLEKLVTLVESNPVPPTPRVEGLFGIRFSHFYINRYDDLDEVAYNFNNRSEHLANLSSDMYPKIDVVKMMEMYSKSEESVLILTGEPGTGKTCFTKMLCKAMSEVKSKDLRIAYVKDPQLLHRDTFWISMQKMEPDLLILDDLDDELKPRVDGKNEIMNHMLSFSDGIFPKRTKIIVTTNQPNSAIDKAIVRPGRCFDVLALPQLSVDEAVGIWVNTYGRSEESFKDTFGDVGDGCRISQAAIASENQRLNLTDRTSYLTDPSISIRTLVESGDVANKA